jgi:hypothetical protein
MVRFSQNYGAQAVKESLDYFKKESGSKTYIIHIRAHDNTGPQTKHHGIFLSKFYYLGTPKKANVDFNSNFRRFIF